MKQTTRWLIGIALPVIIVDQLVKFIVSSALPLGGAWSPLPGPSPLIRIIHTYNTGVAFGLFQDLSAVFTILPLIVSGVMVYYALQLRADQTLLAASFGFVLGGALGNLIDRLRVGYVIDFFDIGLGSLRNASNVADWCIVLGVLLLAIGMWREERRAKLSGDVRSN